MKITDNGPEPNVFDIEKATVENSNYRTVAWTGKYLQVTLMSIPPGSSIGLEKHPETDQFLRLDAGRGVAKMGTNKAKLERTDVSDGWSVQVPAGTWHDVENTGEEDLKLYVVYAPVHHTPGIVQKTSEKADSDEESGKDEPPEWSVQPAPDVEDQKA
jgi:mannose-6-phosphate isomerase-like protein (cupin superfamily)